MHKSVTCPSKASCQHCHLRHHSSLHDSETDVKLPNGKNVAMTSSSNDKKEGIFPVVVVDVNGIRCRALIDSGSGSSYVSTKLIQLLGAKPTETQTRTVDMLMASKVTQLEIYDLELRSVNDQFVLPVRATKVNKAEPLTIENPKYGELIGNYPHLKGVSVNDDYTKPVLPIHVVLGSGEYAKIKTQTKPRIGQQNEPVAELTKFGWFVMSPGTEIEKSTMMLTQASQRDYKDLCRLDVLGLADAPEHDQNTVHAEFKEQLERSPEGWYETGLPWKSNHPELLNNKQVAIEIMSDATFELHKWNSNEPQLEDNDNRTSDSDEQSFAKQQLNVKPTESKMLGLKWDKHQDTLAVMIPTEQAKPTKRGILGKLASIYDPLGLIAPLTLTGKHLS